MPREVGRLVRIGPDRYRVDWDSPRRFEDGRPRGSKPIVPPAQQVPGKKYCLECCRELNRNNRTGLCREHAGHQRVRP
jgi:hypothetical protein